MEEQLSPLAVTHLLQHTLRSLCVNEDSQWVYAVFWRILPRNYPPPKWDLQGGAYDRSRGNRRNWILVWEDGFCNFAASLGNCAGSSAGYGGNNCDSHHIKGLQPELFFKMSHEIYNYGEGLIGKVAADHSHKWVSKETQDNEINFLSAWHNPADSHPRTWEAQFQSGIKTIALIAVREGVVQLGAVNKVVEDLRYIVLLRKKFDYLESIPGVLLPHPSSSAFPFKVDGGGGCNNASEHSWGGFHAASPAPATLAPPPSMDYYNHLSSSQQLRITPSMSSLEALLSKLPSVGTMAPCASQTPPLSPPPVGCSYYETAAPMFLSSAQQGPVGGMDKIAKEELDDDDEEYGSRNNGRGMDLLGGESSSSMSGYYLNVAKPSQGF